MSPIRSRLIAGGVVAAVLCSHAHLSSQRRTLITHDFTSTTHGWRAASDSGAVEPQRHASGGDPGGYISHVDEALGETWYFRAPDEVLRALPAAERGTLRYSLKQSEPVVGIFEDDLVIIGPAGRLSYRFQHAPGTGWSTFSVELDATAGWTWNWNTAATQEQMRRVLANATSLEIRGEFHTGPDEGALDTFSLDVVE